MREYRPDVPIESEEQDRLDRSPFARRLADALISEDGRASGAIVGLTGEWGSGKSSVLNLLERRLREKYPDVIVVRFNPWLVSGRDDVIANFFTTFLEAITTKFGDPQVYGTARDQLAAKAIDAIAKYGGELAPLLNLAGHGLGFVGKFLVKRAEEFIKERNSLGYQKEEMATALRELACPIVVIVDELDRVEDGEIRIMAQVVRSIANFPQISYVLAYDSQRVIEALGGPSDSKDVQRGRAYLEKIVHLQIPLPLLLPNELYNILVADLQEVRGSMAGFAAVNDGRFQELCGLLVPNLIRTARDISKLIAGVGVHAPMVAGDVDWVDIVGFTALEMKAPQIGAIVRTRYNLLVFDALSYDEYLAVAVREGAKGKKSFEDRFAELVPEEKGSNAVRSLFRFLFPNFSGARRADQCHPDEIAFRRPLLTLLRLSVVPGAISRQDALNLLSKTGVTLETAIRAHLEKQTIQNVVERVVEVTIDDPIPVNFWHILITVLEDGPTGNFETDHYRRETLRDAADALHRSARKRKDEPAARVVQRLIEEGRIYFASMVLRGQFGAYGIHGWAQRDRDPLMPRETVETLADRLSNLIEARVGSGLPFRDTLDANPLLLLRDMGRWERSLKPLLWDILQKDWKTVDRLVFWIAGGIYGFDRSTLEMFGDPDAVIALVLRRSQLPDFGTLGELMQNAYAKFKNAMYVGRRDVPANS